MPPYPAFNRKNNKQAWGGDREIDGHAALIAQPKEAHFTGSALYAHLCLWNCNRLFQLHARLDHGVVTTDVLPGVNLWKKPKNHLSCKWCKNFFFRCFFVQLNAVWSTSVTRPLHHSLTVKNKKTPDNKALVFIVTDVRMRALTSRNRSLKEESGISFLCDGFSFTPMMGEGFGDLKDLTLRGDRITLSHFKSEFSQINLEKAPVWVVFCRSVFCRTNRCLLRRKRWEPWSHDRAQTAPLHLGSYIVGSLIWTPQHDLIKTNKQTKQQERHWRLFSTPNWP